MVILVTGGAGFIGSHVCEALLSRGETVVCVDNFNDFYDPTIKEEHIASFVHHKNFILCRVDITDKESLTRIFQQHSPSTVIHLAARAGVRPSFDDPELYHRVNVEGTKNLLELSHEHRLSQFIFGSSSSVYGNSRQIPFSEDDVHLEQISPYAVTKKKAEDLCRLFHTQHGLPITCLRFFTVYGPRGRPDMAIYLFTKNIFKGQPLVIFGDGHSERDYTFISDIVDGILSALSHPFPFEIINLGDSHPAPLRYLISLIENASGKKATIIMKEKQQGDVEKTFARISKAKKLLSYAPKVSIEEGIKRFVEWYKKNHQ